MSDFFTWYLGHGTSMRHKNNSTTRFNRLLQAAINALSVVEITDEQRMISANIWTFEDLRGQQKFPRVSRTFEDSFSPRSDFCGNGKGILFLAAFFKEQNYKNFKMYFSVKLKCIWIHQHQSAYIFDADSQSSYEPMTTNCITSQSLRVILLLILLSWEGEVWGHENDVTNKPKLERRHPSNAELI